MSQHQPQVQMTSSMLIQPEDFETISDVEPSAENGSVFVNALLLLPAYVRNIVIPIMMNPVVKRSIMLFYVSLDPSSIIRRRIETTLIDSILG